MENNTSNNKDKKMAMVFSYLVLRRLVGILGVLFPFILVLGFLIYNCDGQVFQSSISSYYHTCVKHIFGGVLFVIAFFLYAYIGYKDKKGSVSNCKSILCKIDLQDNQVGNLACLCAIGVALFPTTAESQKIGIVGILHIIFAVGFFICLIYFCLCLFTRSKPESLSDRKLKTNKIYKLCGYAIALFILLIPVIGIISRLLGIYELLHDNIKYVFVLETLALWAFGVAWFVKGEGDRAIINLFRTNN